MMGGRVEYLGLGLLGANSAFSLLLQRFLLFSPCAVRARWQPLPSLLKRQGAGQDADTGLRHHLRDLAAFPDLRNLKSCEFPRNYPRFSKLFSQTTSSCQQRSLIFA